MKKLIFLITFLIGIIIFFPFNKVTEYYVNKAIDENKLDITYETIDSSLFATKMSNIRLGNIDINSIIIKHNPFSYLFAKKATLLIYSNNISGNIEYIKNIFKFNLSGDIAIIKKFNKILNLSGIVKLKGFFDPVKNEGRFTATSSEILYKDRKWGKIKLKQVEGIFIYKNNIITVKKLSSMDIPLHITGKIVINKNNILKSLLNLKGSIKFAGMKNNFKIKGSLNSPKIY